MPTSRLRYRATRRALQSMLFVTTFSLLALQCIKGPLQPILPKNTSEIMVPIVDRTYTFEDLIRKDHKFRIDSATGSVSYVPASIAKAPSPITLPSLTPIQGRISNELGVVPLTIPSFPQSSVTFAQIFGTPPPLPWPGPEVTVTPSMANIVGDTAAYDYVVFESGTMSLLITNNFPFSIQFPAGITLVNADDTTQVVATFTYGTIAADSSQSASADLAGIQMSSITRLKLTVQTVDMTGKTMTGSESLVAQPSISGATMSSAKVALTGNYVVNNTPDSAVTLVDDSTFIRTADFKDGKLQIHIVNDIATDIAVDFHLNDFVDRSNRSFTLTDDATGDTSGVVHAKSDLVQTIDLTNYRFVSDKRDLAGNPVPVNVMHFSLSIKTLGATAGKQIISKIDSVQASITPMTNSFGTSDFYISRVSGRVKPTLVAIQDTVPVSIGDISQRLSADSIAFDSVTISLNILSSGLFPTDLALKLVALDNQNVRVATMDAPPTRILPGVPAQIIFSKGTSTIDQFLSNFFRRGAQSPSTILVEGTALVDPPDVYSDPLQAGTVADTDKVYTSVDFVFPIQIGIINGILRDTVVIGDTTGTGQPKFDKKTASSIVDGTILISIHNTFPLALNFSANLMSSKPGQLGTPDSVLLSFGEPPNAPIAVDSATYFSGNQEGVSYPIIALTSAEVEKINPSNFAAMMLKFLTSGNSGAPVVIRRDAKVTVSIAAKVKFLLDPDKFK